MTGEQEGVHHYLLCGLKVESDLAFPELTPWVGLNEQPFDIEFRLGPVEPLKGSDKPGFRFEARGRDGITFHIEHVGRMLVEHGRRIVFDAFPDVDPVRVRLNFIGIIQSMLWHQRGYLPLHASAVTIGKHAIAVGGPSRSGKSVVSAALAARGCQLVADDLSVVDWSSEVPVVLAGYQKLRLWQDACEEFELLDAALAKAHPVRDKFVLETKVAPADGVLPLTDMFILSGERHETLSMERLGPVDGLRNLLTAVHLLEAAHALGLQSQVFQAINQMLATVSIWRVVAPDGLARAGETADAILALVSEERA